MVNSNRWWNLKTDRSKAVYLFLIAIVFVAYLPILRNDFVSDSKVISAMNWEALIGLFSQQYRYIAMLWHIQQHLLAVVIGPIPWVFSAVAIFSHSFVVVLVFAIVKKMVNFYVAVFTALLYACHPFLSESVTWVAAGVYVQYTLLFLASFLLYMLRSRRKEHYYLSLLLFVCMLLTSEKAFSLFGAFFIYEFIFGNFRKNVKYIIPYFLVTLGNIIFIVINAASRSIGLREIYGQNKSVSMFLSIPSAITEYLRLLVWSSNLTLYHSDMYFTRLEFGLRVSVLGVIVALLLYLVYRIVKKKEKTGVWGNESVVPLNKQSHERYILFWSSFFVIALLPTLFSFGLGWIVAERYAYAASLGFFAIVGYGFARAYEKPKYSALVVMVFTFLTIALSVRTVIRNLDWRNEDTLWLATAKTSPMSSNNHNNLGDYYARQKDYNRAIKEFQIALQLQPSYAHAHHNLGNTYRQVAEQFLAQKNTKEATKFLQASLASFEKAYTINPNLWESHVQSAMSYYLLGQKENAIEQLRIAEKINPANEDIRILIEKVNSE